MDTWEAVLTIAGLALISVLTRGFFFLSQRELPLPPWLHASLRYAPLAALAAVVAPQVLLHQGALVSQWADPRVWGALSGAAWFFWRRGILGTIVVGMVVFTALRLVTMAA